jgi:hypothetical protein
VVRRQPFRLPEDATMSGRLPFAVLLLSATFAGHAAQAREVALHGPNGDGGTCVVSRSDGAGTAEQGDAKPAPAKPSAKPAVTRQSGGGGGETSVRSTQAPRWHSFLPGMFR